MEELIATLAELNIAVKLRGSKLDVYDPDGNLSAPLLSSLKKHKQEIISLLADLDSGAAYTSIPAVDQKPFYALSSAQKRLYFLYTLDPSSLAYNMPQIQHFEGIPDKVKLEKAFNLLIDRHEILRTTFHLQEDEPVQKVHARLDFSVIEYSTTDTLTDRVFHDFVRPFNLERGPLLRAAIVTLPDGTHHLMIDMHHIITDGLSYNIMLRDFMSLYRGQPLPQLRLQYRDFAEWQQGEAQQKEMARQKEFWRSEFSDLPPVLDLPQDHERPQVKTYAGDTFERQLDEALYAQLKSLARRSGSTMYTVLLSAFQIMLSRLGRQRDFVVGTPVAGRQHADLEHMIGFFVNTIPIRMSLDGDLTYLDFLKKLQPKVVDCFANQLFQYEEMVDELKIVRDSGRNPLFDVLFTFENFVEEATAATAATASEGSGGSGLQIAKFDLSLLTSESGGLLQLQFEFSTDLFEQKTIERFTAYYENILRSIVAHPNAKLSSIKFLPDAERQHLLHTLNPSPTAYPTDKTLVDLFEAQVDKNPKNTAIVFEGRSWTYEALDREANQLAHFLMTTYDLQKEDLISIQLERSDWLIVSLLAVLKTACAYVPIDSAYPVERIRHIQQDSRCKASIDLAFLEVYRNQTKFDSSRPLIARKPSDLAYVIYTSGSTGQPKGVMVEHGGLVNLCYWHQDVYGLTAASRGTLFAGVAFDASAWEIYPYLLCGASLWPIANSEWRLQVDQLIQFFVENQISHTFLPPLVCQELAESDSALPDLKILTGGDVLSLSKSPKLSIYNNYGPTENTVVTTHFDLRNPYKGSIPIGRPIHNTAVYILSDELQLQPQGAIGELCIAGAGIARGYLNRSELTAEKFVPNPFVDGARMYRSGDLARWLPNGEIEFIGRKDQQVKIRGYRIELSEIESQLLLLEAVRETVVCALGQERQKYLVAYYTAEEAVERSTFIEHLTKSLPDYMLPLHFVKLDKIPLTAHGKIDRKNLPVPDIQSTTTYVAPTNAKEEKMQALWAEILNLKPEQISTDRSFFELGGHSLNAVVLTNKIRKAFEVTLPVTEVFVKQTIARLCKHLEALDKTAYTAIPQAPKQAYYPLSSAQERMYFINSLATESLAYNMPFLQKFEGRPDAVRLEATLKRLVDRHEIFRTTFHWIDQQAKQKIAPSIDIAIEQIQATTTDLSIVFKNFVQPFDLQKGPLLRMALAQLPNGDYYLMFDMHHIISDGISQNVILQDFERLYQGNALSPLRLQYKDFTHWQQREKGQQLAVQKAFWLDLFANEPTALNLPLDHARPSQNTFAGDFYSFRVDEEVSQKLKALSERSGATAFMLFLSAFHILLYKLSGQKDIVIGSPVSGRVHPDVERMVGLFVNTLPLRMELQGQQSFMDFLHAVKDRVLQCLDHQLYPYEELLNALNIDRDASRNPLFDVLFSFENFASQKGEASDDSPHLGPKTAQFDLSLIASESKSHFELSFEYSTALFQKQTIERFAIYLQNILSVIVHQPDKTIAHIDILPPLEREQLLNGFNNSKKAKQVATTTIDLFAAQVRHNPDQVILSYEGAAINYRQLQTYADRLATHLLQQGLTPGSLVGICMGRSIEMIIAMLGIWKAGGAYVPIDPSYPKDRMAYILKDAAVPMVLVDRAGAEVLPTLEGVSILDLQMHPQCYQEESLVDQKLPKLEPGMLAYVIYTSGSTGQPKGVMIEHGSLALRLQEEVELLHLNEEARTCLLTNFVFDVSLLEIFLPMICGGTLVIPSDGLVKDIPALLHLLQKQKVSLLQGTPSLYSSLLAFVDEKVADALSLSTLCVGGESLNQKLVDSIRTKLPNVQLNNHYGPTETTIDALVLEDVRSFDKNSIGRPLGQTEVYIFDEDFALVPQGVVGEICIGGPCLARAYLNQAELSSERFIEHPFHSGERLYRTGDLGCWLPDGQVAFVGRKDNQVKIRGYRMELGEIEQALSKHLMVDQVAVLVFGEAGDNFLAAYYKSEKIIPTDDWQGFLSAQLPTYMIPSCFIHMTAFPVNVNGKIDLKKLPPPNYEMSDQYEAPTNEMERKMIKAWSEVLKIDAAKISINQSFFELGGHSLRAVQLQALLKDQWQMDIALVELFQYPTIRELAQAKYSSSPVSSPSKGIIKLFEPSTKTEGNLFFIHDGSGDVHGYIALAKELETMNCWALRSPTLDGLAVQNDALEALAAVYVERITSIQAHGPYVLAGWSLGGVFALEVARQLEQQGETVEQLFLIDTHFIEEEEAAEDFSVEKEKAYIQTWLGEEMALASEGDDLSDLWQKVLQQLKEDRNKRHRFEQAVPMDIRSMIPYFDALELEKQLAFINTIRSLEKAVACYRPLGKVKCRLTYLKAADSTADVPALSDYAMDPAGVVTLAGNHFTLLQTPYVKALAACFHRLLEPSSEVIESVG